MHRLVGAGDDQRKVDTYRFLGVGQIGFVIVQGESQLDFGVGHFVVIQVCGFHEGFEQYVGLQFGFQLGDQCGEVPQIPREPGFFKFVAGDLSADIFKQAAEVAVIAFQAFDFLLAVLVLRRAPGGFEAFEDGGLDGGEGRVGVVCVATALEIIQGIVDGFADIVGWLGLIAIVHPVAAFARFPEGIVFGRRFAVFEIRLRQHGGSACFPVEIQDGHGHARRGNMVHLHHDLSFLAVHHRIHAAFGHFREHFGDEELGVTFFGQHGGGEILQLTVCVDLSVTRQRILFIGDFEDELIGCVGRKRLFEENIPDAGSDAIIVGGIGFSLFDRVGPGVRGTAFFAAGGHDQQYQKSQDSGELYSFRGEAGTCRHIGMV